MTRIVFMEDARKAKLYLVCFAERSTSLCPVHESGAHMARAEIGTHDPVLLPIAAEPGRQFYAARRPEEFAGDPRWPAACACGYEFTTVDHRVVDQYRVFAHSETGALLAPHEFAPGAVWDAWWHPWRCSAGHCFAIRAPDGGDILPRALGIAWDGHPRNKGPRWRLHKKGLEDQALLYSPRGWKGLLRDGTLVEMR